MTLEGRESGSGGDDSLAADDQGQGTKAVPEVPGIGPKIIKMANVRLSVPEGIFRGPSTRRAP